MLFKARTVSTGLSHRSAQLVRLQSPLVRRRRRAATTAATTASSARLNRPPRRLWTTTEHEWTSSERTTTVPRYDKCGSGSGSGIWATDNTSRIPPRNGHLDAAVVPIGELLDPHTPPSLLGCCYWLHSVDGLVPTLQMRWLWLSAEARSHHRRRRHWRSLLVALEAAAPAAVHTS